MRNTRYFLSVAAVMLGVATPAQAADSCPNAAFRTGASANLPDCRAYEQVSPVDKSGTDVSSGATVSEVADGKVYFNTSGSINNANTVTFYTGFLGTRGADWATQAIDPPTSSAGALIGKLTFGISADGTKTVILTTRALAPGAIEGGSNLYIHDLLAGTYRLIVSNKSALLYGTTVNYIAGAGNYLGGTDDLSTIAIISPVPLTDEPVPPRDYQALSYAYMWHDGQLALASKAPGAQGRALPVVKPGNDTPPRSNPVLSRDGTRLTFQSAYSDTDPNPSATYQYKWGEGSTLLSRVERTGGNDAPSATPLPFASADGKTVYFQAFEDLTDQPHPSHFYRWSAAGNTLTPVAPNAKKVFAVSPGGRYVYSTSRDDDSPTPAGAVWVADTQEGTDRKIATLPGTQEESGLTGSDLRMSPDGRRLLFVSFSPVTGRDNRNPSCIDASGQRGSCGNLYSYDTNEPDKPVVCVSCTDGQDRGKATVSDSADAFDGRVNRPIKNDGRVFFHTPSKLVSADTDTADDVYEYVPGSGPRLLSRGATPDRATFQDASPDASNVYFVTTDQLVPQDTDGLADLYTARVNGGIASQQVAPAVTDGGCSGEACRPGSPAAPADPTPGSLELRSLPKAATPRFSVGGVSASARTGRVTVPVKVSTAGRLAATLQGRLGGKSTRTAATASGRASKAGTVKLALRLSKAARAALARDGRLRVRLTVRFSEVSKPATRTVTIRAASPSRGGAR